MRVARVFLLGNADQRHGEHLTMYVIYGRRQLIRNAFFFFGIAITFAILFIWGWV